MSVNRSLNNSNNTLWNKDFILFFICTAQSSLGSSIAGITLSFLVLKLTGSASSMSITLAFNFLPTILTPFFATFVDRLPLKPPMIIGIVVRGLILISVYIGIKSGFINIYGIYVMSLATGIIAAFYGPASQSLMPFLVPEDQLPRGNALLGTANNSTALIGLLFGGMLVGFFGPAFALLIEGVCYIISGILLFFVNMPPSAVANLANSFWRDFILGLEVIKKSNIILVLITMFFLINLIMSPMEVLLPVHMNFIGRGALGYGMFMALVVAGTLSGNAAIVMFGENFNSAKGVLYSWLGIAVSLVGLALLNNFYLCLFWALLLGVNIAISNTGITVVLQKIVPVEFRARVFGSAGAVTQLGIPFSLITLSYIVNKITLSEIFICGAVLSVAFAVLWNLTWNYCGCQKLRKCGDP